MKNIFFALTASLFLFAGCDYVTIPQQAGGTIITPTSDTIRRIFIEDFTGHTCPNCPKAARVIDSLERAYPGHIIAMAVHSSGFADPCPPAPLPAGANAGTFTEDFRVTSEDAEYNTIFGNNSWPYPSLMVNRSGFPNFIPTAYTDAPTLTANLLAQPMTAYLKVTPSYNSGTREITATVSGEFLVDTTGTFNVALFLTEDSLTGAQEDNTLPSGFDYNYVFNHVFRGCINSQGSCIGQTVVTGTITAHTGITLPTAFPTFTLNAAYNPAHCHVIAILMKTGDYGVLQAAESKLIP